MTTSLRSSILTAACFLCSALAGAQSAGTTSPPPDASVRPATATFLGDTGFWFVPTADILDRHTFSASGYRAGLNYPEGFTNVGVFNATFAFGLFTGLEVFGAFNFDTRIDRDLRPIFTANPEVGGVLVNHPFVNQYWTGDNVGDVYIGMKSGLVQQRYGKHSYSFSMRGVFKIPTADRDRGLGTGKLDTLIQGVLSSDINKVAEISGYGGVMLRGKSPLIGLPNSFTWGLGAAFPSHSALRITTEVHGERPFQDTLTLLAPVMGIDGSRAPLTSATHNFTATTFGLTWQARNGFFLGGGASWNLPTKSRRGFRTDGNATGNFVDVQVRLGFHPGVRQYAPSPPPPSPPPPPAPVHNLSVRAECDPCTVEVLSSSTVTAMAQSSIACVVTYRWAAPTGTFADPAAAETMWTAPDQEGSVPATVTVTCPTDNRTASDTVNIQVTRPPVKTYTFEDVHFDFDRYSLRPEATRVLDEAVSAMQADATLRLQIEGHTCNIGTAEYNLALGDRRSNAVRAYLASRGIAADRMTTISYGEERPQYDNAREETRRLNRRAALVVNLQR